MIATPIGTLALVTAVAFAGAASGDTPGVPTSTVKAFAEHTAQYCVSGYAPKAEVSVRNERTGATATIRTNIRGRGCADVGVDVACGKAVTQTIVAAGVGADGNPATSQARAAAPSNAPGCSTNLAGDNRSVSTGLSGTSVALIALGSAALLVLVAIGVVLVRRRRSPAA